VKLQEEPLIVASRQLTSQHGWIPHTLWEILSIWYPIIGHVRSRGWILFGLHGQLSGYGWLPLIRTTS